VYTDVPAGSGNNISESIGHRTGSRSDFISVSLEGRDIDSYRGIARAQEREEEKEREGEQAGKENEKRDKIELLRGDESAGGMDARKRAGKCGSTERE